MKIDYNNTTAGSYARFRKVNPSILERLIQLGRIDKSSCILEVGCGSGNYVSAIGERVHCQCHGLEPSEGMLAHAKSRNIDVQWTVGDAQAIPYPDGTFDFLYCVDVIHHVPEPSRFVSESFRVMRDKGVICISTDSEWTIRNRNPLSTFFPETVERELKRYLPLDQLKKIINEAGFLSLKEEIVESPYTLENADAFRAKAYSCLHLISETNFRRGLSALSGALDNGPLHCVARSVLLNATKG